MENDVEKTILETINKLSMDGVFDVIKELNDDTVLLESGIDSLGFAILVAELENVIGYDPFVLMEDPIYPRTLKEFVEIYSLYSK
ncbi:phosphopantetheine-binding protein [Comamonas aquatica]|uniref:phosphopantetheine-binding protein n=1 Tax=Comamonas aquatica TaxID=225991 RepID=UPI0021B11ECE|nr:phosphopantetheine-binding protein [Comamonas aquatica]